MASFFKRLSYSIGNEDWITEKKALGIKPADTVLTVTASGDRPLNLLYSECKKIISLDANPFQTALCDLKKAALARLDYDEYLGFLGLLPHHDRLKTLRKLEGHMMTNSIICWRENREKIEKGISYQGQVEKLCKTISKLICKVNGKKIEQLFAFNTIDQQREFLDTHWNWATWKKVCTVALHPVFSRFFIKDPGLYRNLGDNIKPSAYFYKRIEKSLKQHPVKENLILSLVFQGRVFEEGYSPHLLQDEGKEIKSRLPSLQLKTLNVLDFLENTEENSIDCFSLSDVASYMSKENFFRLCRGVKRAAKPNARFCIRQFMSAYEFPEDVSAHFVRHPELEAELENEDRCFLYRFTVGRISK